MRSKKRDFNFILGICLLAITLIPAFVGLFWTPYDPEKMDYSMKLAGISIRHIYGCDNFGRDVFSRIMSGSGITLLIAVGTVLFGSILGTVIGCFTGYYGGLIDECLMRINDVALAFPSLLLALVIVSLMGTGKYQVMLALGLAFIPSYARIVRGEYLRIKNLDYVKAAKLAGASDMRIMFVHILPNTKTVLFSSVLIGFNNAILAEAGLSFLGIGVQPPDASLGRMLSEAQAYMFTNPSYVLFTGCTIVMLILGFSLLSKAKRWQ
ncbi:MAG: ABC transporter permease [Lachnospiraceae bacterium]|nr:ABC transporter permease [Lachnospiraceae bacterium]